MELGANVAGTGAGNRGPRRAAIQAAIALSLVAAACTALLIGFRVLHPGEPGRSASAAAHYTPADEGGAIPEQMASAQAGSPTADHGGEAPLQIETAMIVAEVEGDGSGYEWPGELVGSRTNPGKVALESRVLNPNSPAEDKLEALAALGEVIESKEETVSLMTRIVSDPGQPEEVRADAVAKLADYGPEYVAWLVNSDSPAVAAEAELVVRLEEFRVQQGLPRGTLRADLRR